MWSTTNPNDVGVPTVFSFNTNPSLVLNWTPANDKTLGFTSVTLSFLLSSLFTSGKEGVGITGVGLTFSTGLSTLFKFGKIGVGTTGIGLTTSAGFSTLFLGI